MVYKGNMRNVEAIAARKIPHLLEEWLESRVEADHNVPYRRGDIDLVARAGDHTYVVEVKGTDDVATLKRGIQHLNAYVSKMQNAISVIVAPFMGPKAREFLKRQSQSWMDLSGNADIRGPGLCIVVQGKPNSFAARGRPSSAFSPKASRLSRTMLMAPEKCWLQTELVDATGLSAGYVSKVVGRLIDDDLVKRVNGAVRPRDPSLLLDAWLQVYDFSQHEISRYHAVGNTGAAVLRRLAASLDEVGDLTWAATGLAAAWQFDQYADFRLVTLYISKPLLEPEDLSLRPVERGENVWVVLPRDEGVLQGSQDVKGVRCAHPVQVYLDLLGHP
jgi:hypothetical protein